MGIRLALTKAFIIALRLKDKGVLVYKFDLDTSSSRLLPSASSINEYTDGNFVGGKLRPRAMALCVIDRAPGVQSHDTGAASPL